MKATEQYVPVVLFIVLYKVVLTFESVVEILKYDNSNESYWAVRLLLLLLFFNFLQEEILQNFSSVWCVTLMLVLCYNCSSILQCALRGLLTHLTSACCCLDRGGRGARFLICGGTWRKRNVWETNNNRRHCHESPEVVWIRDPLGCQTPRLH